MGGRRASNGVGQGEASFRSKRVWRVGGFKRRNGRDACDGVGATRSWTGIPYAELRRVKAQTMQIIQHHRDPPQRTADCQAGDRWRAGGLAVAPVARHS